MTLRIDPKKLKNWVLYLLLFFAAMNFKAKFFYFVFAAFGILLATQKNLKINKTSLVYLALGGLMVVYNSDEGVLSMCRCMAYFMLYVLGYNMPVVLSGSKLQTVEENVKYAHNTGFAMLTSVCAGSFLHFFLNAVHNFGKSIGRNTIDIWSGTIMAATGQVALTCLMLGLSVSMLYKPVKKSYRYIGILCIVCMLAYNLVLAGRTMLVILFAVFILGLIYTVKVSKSSEEKFRLGMGLISSVVVVSMVFLFDIGGIQNYIFSSNLFDRLGSSLGAYVSNSSRNTIKLKFLSEGWKYPFGGLNMRSKYGYAHDLLLDGYDEYGIFGLLLLVAIVLLGIIALYRLLKRTSYGTELKLALLCVYCAVLLEFCVEPILAGMAWLFACYSLINGIMDGMNYTHYLTVRSDK